MTKSRTNIVYIITGLSRGGAETLLLNLIKHYALPPYSYHQTVIFFKQGALFNDFKLATDNVYQTTYWGVYGLLKKIKPDIIHSSLWSANIIARWCGWQLAIPVYATLHTVAPHSGILRNTIDRFFPLQAKKYIAVSSQINESYSKLLPKKLLVTIPNGIPHRLELPSLNHGPRSEHYTIGAVGRFVPVKCYDILIKAFALLHQQHAHARLMLIGYGPRESMLRQLTITLGIEQAVTFIIDTPAETYYKLFNCFVQPSAYEGFSLTTAEALQNSIPVIVTGHKNKHPFIEHNKTGLVMRPYSVQDLYNALHCYITDQVLARAHARNGNRYVKKHCLLSTMAQQYHQLFTA